MGEGWGDFVATILRTTRFTKRTDNFPIGAYVIGRTNGIRHYVVSFILTFYLLLIVLKSSIPKTELSRFIELPISNVDRKQHMYLATIVHSTTDKKVCPDVYAVATFFSSNLLPYCYASCSASVLRSFLCRAYITSHGRRFDERKSSHHVCVSANLLFFLQSWGSGTILTYIESTRILTHIMHLILQYSTSLTTNPTTYGYLRKPAYAEVHNAGKCRNILAFKYIT